MNISFGKKILFGFALSLCVLGAIGLASYLTALRYADSVTWTKKSHKVIEALAKVLSDVKDAETGTRGFIITGDESYLEPYTEGQIAFKHDLSDLKSLLADNSAQMQKIHLLDILCNSKFERLDSSVTIRRAESSNTLLKRITSGRGKLIMDQIRLVIQEMTEMENALLLLREQRLRDDSSLNGLVNFTGVLGILTLLIALYFLLGNEIKRRNRAEAEIRKSNTFLTAILENIPNMIFVKEAAELRFVRVNKAGEDLVGYSQSALLGKNDYDFFSKEQADFFVSKDREVLNNGRMIDVPEEPIMTQAKGERWLHTKKIPIPGTTDNGPFLLGISEDITDIKKQQDAIIHLNRELEAFSYSVSHDLRGPLSTINSIAKLLEQEYGSKFDSEGIRLLGMLRNTSQSLTALIQDLLAFAHIGRQQIERNKVEMTELCHSAEKEVRISMPESKAELRIADLPPASGDSVLLKQVLVNLLSNAMKYSKKSHDPLIEVGAKSMDGQIVYFVKDNGAGFDMRDSNKLFVVFQRLHQQSDFEGTGIGLAIVERIITKHGGKVWAEGKTGEGATFYFTIPS